MRQNAFEYGQLTPQVTHSINSKIKSEIPFEAAISHRNPARTSQHRKGSDYGSFSFVFSN